MAAMIASRSCWSAVARAEASDVLVGHGGRLRPGRRRGRARTRVPPPPARSAAGSRAADPALTAGSTSAPPRRRARRPRHVPACRGLRRPPPYPGSTMTSVLLAARQWMDRAVRHRRRSEGVLPPCRSREADGLPHAAPAARPTCARGRHVRRHCQPGLPRPSSSGTRSLMRALSGIPDVQARDSVWWHCRHDPQRLAGPATSRAGATSCTSRPPPGAPATRRYAASLREAFLHRRQPERLPRGALRAQLARPLRCPSCSTRRGDAASA